MAGLGDEMTARAGGHGYLRASHADREQAIGTLKAAFVHGIVAKNEFDQRVGQAFVARTHADLVALTADLPAGLTAQPSTSSQAIDARVLQSAKVSAAATALYAVVWPFTHLVPWPTNSEGDPPAAITMLFFRPPLSTYLFWS